MFQYYCVKKIICRELFIKILHIKLFLDSLKKEQKLAVILLI